MYICTSSFVSLETTLRVILQGFVDPKMQQFPSVVICHPLIILKEGRLFNCLFVAYVTILTYRLNLGKTQYS